jgi:hypothetical protein
MQQFSPPKTIIRNGRTPDSNRRRKSKKRELKKSLNTILGNPSYSIRDNILVTRICPKPQKSLESN